MTDIDQNVLHEFLCKVVLQLEAPASVDLPYLQELPANNFLQDASLIGRD